MAHKKRTLRPGIIRDVILYYKQCWANLWDNGFVKEEKMRTLSVIMYSMVISFGVFQKCAMQVVKMSRQLNDNEQKQKNVAAHDGILSCEGIHGDIGCTKVQTNEGFFYLFVAIGSTFGLLGMFLSLWMACTYLHRTYVPRDERLLHSTAWFILRRCVLRISLNLILTSHVDIYKILWKCYKWNIHKSLTDKSHHTNETLIIKSTVYRNFRYGDVRVGALWKLFVKNTIFRWKKDKCDFKLWKFYICSRHRLCILMWSVLAITF